MSDEATSAPATSSHSEAPSDVPEVPFAFGCALWVPVFAVLLYFFTMFLRPRISVDHGASPSEDAPEP